MNESASTRAHLREARMAELIGLLAPNEGYTRSLLDEVKFLRANSPLPRTPVLYEPCIIIVCKGRKKGFFADREYLYDAQHYLVLSLPLPFESQTEACPTDPMLAISIRVDAAILADLALSVSTPPSDSGSVGISSAPMEDKLGDAVVRLLKALASNEETDVLGRSLLREIYYRVLSGPHGAALRETLTYQSSFARIGRALKIIHANVSQPMSVESLAEAAAMSVATFHVRFKSVTGTSPLQYIKTARLHRARMLMIQEGQTAALAAINVGYESPSQFSREFKRFFGRSPADEARVMKEAMALRQRVEIPAMSVRN